MQIKLVSPFDAHLHLRDGAMLAATVPASSRDFAGAIVMPNLTPPITVAAQAEDYAARITAHSAGDFEPFVSLFLDENITADELAKSAKTPKQVKLYPSGITTNSENGVKTLHSAKLDALFDQMSERGVALSIHGETNGFVLEREAEFAEIYETLARKHPKLVIIMEHISTAKLAQLLDKYENLYATITLHHLLFTLDDLLGGKLNPHLFCKPIVKTPRDREALRTLTFSAHPKVAFGSDSAPHLRSDKESNGAAGGIFSAAYALPMLAELFAAHDALDNLQPFVNERAQAIYKLDLPHKEVILTDQPQQIAREIGGVVPMCAGKTIGWKRLD
ncbi:dihydroorotase [Campylobacterota bacterium]|nr:dihydroorotase [Campylobacterota bacterium]